MLEPQVFRTKPAVSRELLAMQWDGSEESQSAIVTWGGGKIVGFFDTAYFLEIHGPGVKLRVDPGDWVVEIGPGSFVPCKADQFAESYEPLTATQPKDTHLSGDGERLEEAVSVLQWAITSDAAVERLTDRYHGQAPIDESFSDEEREDTVARNKARERARADLQLLATRLSPENSSGETEHCETALEAHASGALRCGCGHTRARHADGPAAWGGACSADECNCDSFMVDPEVLPENSSGEEEGVDWRARAVSHAKALASMLSAKPVYEGTFGATWLDEATETVRLDLGTEPFAAGATALHKDDTIGTSQPVSPQPDPTTRRSEGTGDDLRKRLRETALRLDCDCPAKSDDRLDQHADECPMGVAGRLIASLCQARTPTRGGVDPEMATTSEQMQVEIARRVREETERRAGGEFSPQDRRAVESVIAEVVAGAFECVDTRTPYEQAEDLALHIGDVAEIDVGDDGGQVKVAIEAWFRSTCVHCGATAERGEELGWTEVPGPDDLVGLACLTCSKNPPTPDTEASS